MRKDKMTELDVRNTLRGGTRVFAERETGSWRYRFETSPFVVIAFRAIDRRDGLAIPEVMR